MKEQFCSYGISLKLKELGFDEKCFATYYGVNDELHGFPLADMGGELIKIWDSISLASKKTASSKSSIIRCCKNKQKTCNNFIWKYLNN